MLCFFERVPDTAHHRREHSIASAGECGPPASQELYLCENVDGINESAHVGLERVSAHQPIKNKAPIGQIKAPIPYAGARTAPRSQACGRVANSSASPSSVLKPTEEDAEILDKVETVRSSIEALIKRGRAERKGLFFA